MSQLKILPNYPVSLIEGGRTQKDWYFFFAATFNGLAPAREAAITVGASPYVYTAPRGGFVILSGGTVTSVEWSRDGTTWFTTGAIAGCFPVSAQDQLRITHAGAPAVAEFVPT